MGKDARSLIRKRLGKETGDAILQKIDKMVSQQAPASVIKKTIREHLSTHMQDTHRIITDFIEDRR